MLRFGVVTLRVFLYDGETSTKWPRTFVRLGHRDWALTDGGVEQKYVGFNAASILKFLLCLATAVGSYQVFHLGIAIAAALVFVPLLLFAVVASLELLKAGLRPTSPVRCGSILGATKKGLKDRGPLKTPLRSQN